MENNINLNLLKKTLTEYAEGLIGLIINNMHSLNANLDELNKCNNVLKEVIEKIENADTVKELKSIKELIINVDNLLTATINNSNSKPLSSREQALVDRGYSESEVRRLASFDERLLEPISDNIIFRITRNCKRVDNPTCVFLGGQPGCGKTSASMNLKATSFKENGIVELGIDNYRTYHPNYLEIEEKIKDHWKDRVATENDSPGNDIADFTHNFAGIMTDILTDKISKDVDGKRYNIVFEWGMRTPDGPIETMRDLKQKGYQNLVDFIAVHKDISLEACKIRADVMNNQNHIVRRVPNYFHELCINTLPDSCNEIYKRGAVEDNIVDDFIITTRDGNTVWQKNDNNIKPGTIYQEYLQNPDLSINFQNNSDLAEIAYRNEAYGFKDNHYNEMKFMFDDEENIEELTESNDFNKVI